MTSLPVIPGIYRITMEWSTAVGITPRNVLHVQSTSTDVEQVGTFFVASLQPHQFEGMAGDHILNSIGVLPLDGVTGTLEVDGTGYSSGSSSGDRSPATSIVVSHHTAVRGPRGRGRTYIGPVLESVASSGLLGGSNAIEITAAWVAFQTSLQTAHDEVLNFVVASYKHAVANVVVSERCDLVLGTQRRRQDQLR